VWGAAVLSAAKTIAVWLCTASVSASAKPL